MSYKAWTLELLINDGLIFRENVSPKRASTIYDLSTIQLSFD